MNVKLTARQVNFNPRSREGSDRTLSCSFHAIIPYFNPRSREGSDTGTAEQNTKLVISIHAPAKGATESRW